MTTGHYNHSMRRRIYKEDIIKAGMELMFLNGYGGTGIKDITEKIGIPKGSFYNHFKSKEAFGLQVLEYYMEDAFNKLNELLADNTLEPIERLKTFFQMTIDEQNMVYKYKYGCLLGNFSQELSDVNEVFRKVIQTYFHKMKDHLKRCIEEARDKGQIKTEKSSEMLADFLITGWEGTFIRVKAEKSTLPIENFRDVLFSDVLI